MRTACLYVTTAAVVLLAGAAARAELCPKCKKTIYTADVGKCAVCGEGTASGAFKLCKACSAKLGQCEYCRAPLLAAGPVEGPVPTGQAPPPRALPETTQPAAEKIDTARSKVYVSGKWKYSYVINAPGTRSEATYGRLYYDGRELTDGDGPTNNYYVTPWGRLYNTGQPNTPFGPHGWMPQPRAGPPEGKQLPDPGPAVAAAQVDDLAIDETFVGKTVSAVVGQKALIRLPSEGPGPKPPPKWTAKLQGDSLQQEGEIRLRARTIPGPGGLVGIQQGGPMTLEAAFRAVKPGKATVTLEARPWQEPDAAPTRTFTVTLDVQALADPSKDGAAPPAAIKSLVPGRMVCCEACKAKLDLANGVKKCPGCGELCNVAHKMCTKCAAAGVCEVCGKAMAAPATQPAGREPLVLGEADDGKTVTASAGQELVIRLPANPSTGYSWGAPAIAGEKRRACN